MTEPPEPPAIRLSAVVLTRDEERDIGRCLDSLAGVADEVLVVDSYSTDRTEAICREKGARFLQHPFEGYVEQKRWALGQARHEHVLSLDADEALSPELRAAILAVKADWRADAYRFARRNYYCGQWIYHGAWYPDRKLRLIRRGAAAWAGSNPHDRLEPAPGVTVVDLPGDLLHYTYYSVAEHLAQTGRFAAIAAEAAHAEGRRVSLPGLLFRPLFRFFRDFVLKRGFLDGEAGLVVALMTAYGTFLKYALLRERWRGMSG